MVDPSPKPHAPATAQYPSTPSHCTLYFKYPQLQGLRGSRLAAPIYLRAAQPPRVQA
jgi:hypothetical protein